MSVQKHLLRVAKFEDLEEIAKLETESFPVDEAASSYTIRYRFTQAGDYMYTYRTKDQSNALVGFVNGTCVKENSINHESMSHHEPNGTVLVIHSVTIDHNVRRQGLGSLMLKDYISAIAKIDRIENILLLSKPAMLTFYLNCGFQLAGVSSVAHGKVRHSTYRITCVATDHANGVTSVGALTQTLMA